MRSAKSPFADQYTDGIMIKIRVDKIRYKAQRSYLRKGQKIVHLGDEEVVTGNRLRVILPVEIDGQRHEVRRSIALKSESPTALDEAKRQLKKLVLEAVDAEVASLQNAHITRAAVDLKLELGQIHSEVNHVAEQVRALDGSKEEKARCRSLTAACLLYLNDFEWVDAGLGTRRIYESYFRNHVAVPTAEGRGAIGDLPLESIDDRVLRKYEESMYLDRDGYRLDRKVVNPQAKETPHFTEEHFARDGKLPMSATSLEPLEPPSVKKVLLFLSAVANYAHRHHKDRWPSGSNAFQSYRMKASPTSPRKVSVPRSKEYYRLIELAEESGLTYMVPLMALVRSCFRLNEARALRWKDLWEPGKYKNEHARVLVHQTLETNVAGGERLKAGAKTAAATTDYVDLDMETYELLVRYRPSNSTEDDFICFPTPGSRSAFLAEDAYLTAWSILREKANLPPDSNIYTLKHGMVADLLMRGYKGSAIVGLTRHVSAAMVDRIYNGLSSTDLARARDEMATDRAQEASKE